MKKFFKLFAVALVAGCMFAACGNDDETENGNGNNGGNNGGNTQADGIYVTFLGETWSPAQINTNAYYSDYNVVSYDLYKTEEENSYPSVDGALVLANGETGSYYNSYWEDGGYYTDSTQTTVVGDHVWMGSSTCGDITTADVVFDASTLVLSMNVTIPMLDLDAYVDSEGATTQIDNETLVYQNVTLTSSK